jgi:DprA winged helix domain
MMDAKSPSPLAVVERQLGPDYVSIDQIAANTKLTAAMVLDALEALERRYGIGSYIDVSSANNVSVRLRNPREAT